MKTSSNGNISALLAICARNSSVTGEFPAQRPVTQGFDVFYDLRINGCVNNGEDGDLRRYGAHYDVIVMDEGLLSIRCKAIILTSAMSLSIGPLGTYFSGISTKIHDFHWWKWMLKYCLRPFYIDFSLWICLLRSKCCHVRYATQALRPLFSK